MHLSMFTPRGVCGGGEGLRPDYPQELDFFENLWSNSLPKSHKCVSNILCTCLKKFTQNFFLELQSKASKVPSLCQSVLSNSRGK